MHYFKPDGTKVIDATSGLFCVNAGHCREPIVKAIQEMAAKLDYSPAFQYGHPKVFELASRLSLLAPGTLDYAFFSNSGSEAVDTALKIALAYHKARGEGRRTRLIGRERGYHGIGFGGISVGGIVANRKQFGNMLTASITCQHLRPLQAGLQQGRAGVGRAPGRRADPSRSTARCLHHRRRHRRAGRRGPRASCRRPRVSEEAARDHAQHGILLIFDEVITGFGRLGTASPRSATASSPT
jgi:beta-alanine--pyruvate transaminase